MHVNNDCEARMAAKTEGRFPGRCCGPTKSLGQSGFQVLRLGVLHPIKG